jgi:hypothetical protein
MLFREIIHVYYENHTKPINLLCGQNTDVSIVNAGGKRWLLIIDFVHFVMVLCLLSFNIRSLHHVEWGSRVCTFVCSRVIFPKLQ